MALGPRAESVIRSLVAGELTFSDHALDDDHYDTDTAEGLADSYKKGFAQNGVFYFDFDNTPDRPGLMNHYHIGPRVAPTVPKKNPEEYSDEFAARKLEYTRLKNKNLYQVSKNNVRIENGKAILATVNDAAAAMTDDAVKMLVVKAFLLQPKAMLSDSPSGDRVAIEGPIPPGFYGMVRLPGALLVDGQSWLPADAMRVIVPGAGNARVITAYPVSYDPALS